MRNANFRATFVLFLVALFGLSVASVSAVDVGAGVKDGEMEWRQVAPRDEIRPQFEYSPRGGPKGAGRLMLSAGDQPGLMGWWEARVPVSGGATVEFTVWRKSVGIEVPRRTAVVRLLWRDSSGKPVLHDEPSNASYLKGQRPRAEPEFPADTDERRDDWVLVRGVYHVPSDATHVVVELG